MAQSSCRCASSGKKGEAFCRDEYGKAMVQHAKKNGLTQAQCWAHSRRKVFEAKAFEPTYAEHCSRGWGRLFLLQSLCRHCE